MSTLTDLFVPFKVVQSSRVETKLPDIQTNWLDYMQSRNNQILPQENVLPDPDEPQEGSSFDWFPRIPIDNPSNPISAGSSIGTQPGNRIRNIQQKRADRYQDYINEYERYVSNHPEDSDEEMRVILSNIAAHESAYNPQAQNPKSSASGWFQFIDSTRQSYTTMNREQFKQDRQEQIAAATKLYKAIYNKYYNSPKWKSLIDKRGLSVAQVIYGGWFRPASLQNYLEKGYDTYADPQGTTLQKVWDSYK